MRSLLVLLVLLLLPALAPQARAQAASAFASNDQGEVRLLAATTGVGSSKDVQLGLEFDLKPGWKIYWRSPGAAGFPPSIDWSKSSNLASADIAWPAPVRFTYVDLETMGYEGQVVLPLAVHLAQAGQPLHAAAAVDYLVCAEICVPRHADLSLDLPAGLALPSHDFGLIGRFVAKVPGNGAGAGLALVSAAGGAHGPLTVTVTADPPLSHPDLFVERADQLQFTTPKVRLSDGGRRATLTAPVLAQSGADGDKAASLPGSSVTITLVDGDRSMEAITTVAQAPAEQGDGALFAMLGVALLGGLILNLMPCVLPVLAIKLVAVTGLAGAARRQVRMSFLATAAGVVTSFLVLAAAIWGIRAAGGAVGWGLQFQQPAFLAVMGVMVVLFAANLLGLFEIALPWWMTGSASKGGAFASGVFATLLATPCSAPFVGTAVGFALVRGPLEIGAIFAALGLGMALPYLAVAALPGMILVLPRPGMWMIWLRRVLGLALIGTAAWLVFVLDAEAGRVEALAVGGAMLVVLALLAIGRNWQGRWRAALVAIPVVAAPVIALALPVAGAASPAGIVARYWRPFDPETIAADVSGGNLVFVDVTARWCITCQVNEAAVIGRGAVADRLGSSKIVAMRGDWTRPDPGIADYLAQFGRYGIPFDIVYGPGAPNGIALPELLTEQIVLDALDRAAKPTDQGPAG